MKLSILSIVALASGVMADAAIWFWSNNNCDHDAFIADALPLNNECFNFGPNAASGARVVDCEGTNFCGCLIYPEANCNGQSFQVDNVGGRSLHCGLGFSQISSGKCFSE